MRLNRKANYRQDVKRVTSCQLVALTGLGMHEAFAMLADGYRQVVGATDGADDAIATDTDTDTVSS